MLYCGMKLVIAFTYRPPSQLVQTERDINEQISEISKAHDAVIHGDFMTLVSWSESMSLSNS